MQQLFTKTIIPIFSLVNSFLVDFLGLNLAPLDVEMVTGGSAANLAQGLVVTEVTPVLSIKIIIVNKTDFRGKYLLH